MEAMDNRGHLTIAGQHFTRWTPVGPASRPTAMLAVIVDDDWSTVFLGQLGSYIPGQLQDGTHMDFYVYSVERTGINSAKVLFVPQARLMP
jgi:hypothetical protein